MPLVARAEYAGVCPRLFASAFALECLTALSWWEKGQLGLSFTTAPIWVREAFGMLSSEMSRAREFRRRNAPKTSGRKG